MDEHDQQFHGTNFFRVRRGNGGMKRVRLARAFSGQVVVNQNAVLFDVLNRRDADIHHADFVLLNQILRVTACDSAAADKTDFHVVAS